MALLGLDTVVMAMLSLLSVHRSWLCRLKGKLKRRYIVAILAFLGFCNIYMLRYNFWLRITVAVRKLSRENNIY